MVKKSLNPKVLIHLTISPDMKQFLIDNNINASELLEQAITELMDITKNIVQEDISEYYEDIKKRFEHDGFLTIPYQFEDKVYFRELQIRILNYLRHKLGFNLENAKKILERYVKDKQKEIMENFEKDREKDYQLSEDY